MATPSSPEQSDESLLRAGARRAAAVLEALRHDDQSLAVDPKLHEGHAHFARAVSAVERLVAELNEATAMPRPASEAPRP